MKKIVLLMAVFATAVLSANADEYFLDIPAIYQEILDGTITQVDAPSGTKYLFNDNVTQGIFTVWSPDSRQMRIDTQAGSTPSEVQWTDGTTASTYRLEPNGASNSSNGRKIYIDCPAAGTLTVGAWTTTSGRGYTLESAATIGGNATGTLLDDTYAGNVPLLGTDPMTPQTFTISGPMIVDLNPDGGFYYGFIKFVTGGEQPTEATLKLLQPSVGGSLTASPDKTVYDINEEVTITATPAEGYELQNFSVDGIVTPATSENTLVLTMDANKRVSAIFQTTMALQNYDWYFIDDVLFPDPANTPIGDAVSGGYTEAVTIAGLTFVPNLSVTATQNFGKITTSSKVVDGVTYTRAMQFSGSGYSSASDADDAPAVNMPTQRYLSFDVTGNVTVDIIGITGSSSSSRKIFLTDGTDFIGSFDFPAGTDASKETVSYEGAAATLYLFCNAACNVYEIIVTGEEPGPDGISSVAAQKTVQSVEYFDLLGKKVANENQKQTVLIKKTTYTDGTTSSSKILTKAE